MLRNYLAASLRNLVRNRLYTAINIIGLSAGFAAALLIALFVRDELSYDRWLPEHESLYRASTVFVGSSGQESFNPRTSPAIAGLLKLNFPEIRAVVRIANETVSLRHGDTESMELVSWADPEILQVLRLPVVAGDASAPLPADGIALTQRMARKLFGRDNPVGEVVDIDRQHPMVVTAVLRDLPSNTHLNTEIIASGKAAFTGLARIDAVTGPDAGVRTNVYTYFRLTRPEAITGMEQGLAAFAARHMRFEYQGVRANARLRLLPVTAIHLDPTPRTDMKLPGDPAMAYGLAAIGVLTVLVAAINFVNLMTARASKRVIEVGVRKATGARRRNLIVQFIGESLIYAVLGLALALGTVHFALPALNSSLDRTISFAYGEDAALAATVAGLAIAVGVLAGIYPAFVLSSFPPAAVLKDAKKASPRAARFRQALIVMQFAFLIGLCFATVVIYRQTDFALSEALRFDKEQVILVNTSWSTCTGAFRDRALNLPGVRGATCSTSAPLRTPVGTIAQAPNGARVGFIISAVDFNFFDFYGLGPVAGRNLSPDRGGDFISAGTARTQQPAVLVNETAARALGFGAPGDAVGAAVAWSRPQGVDGGQSEIAPSEIAGVVPDFPMGSIRRTVSATLFYVVDPRMSPGAPALMSLRLGGGQVAETLAALDGLWRQAGDPRPLQRMFFDQFTQDLYQDVARQGQLFATFAGVTVLIAVLGLFGLSTFTAETRTKEIGIRKTMGASRADVMRLLLWQFAKPVLLANIIAWPAGYIVMGRWLEGFAYHVDLAAWQFLAASALALVIALATILGHTFKAAGSQPVTSLRYE